MEQTKDEKKKAFWKTVKDILLTVGQMVITALIDKKKKK